MYTKSFTADHLIPKGLSMYKKNCKSGQLQTVNVYLMANNDCGFLFKKKNKIKMFCSFYYFKLCFGLLTEEEYLNNQLIQAFQFFF